MKLIREVQDVVSAYVCGKTSLEDVRDWLGRHVQAVADQGDTSLAGLYGEAWLLISEYDLGHRSEDSVRTELKRAISPMRSVIGPPEQIWSDPALR